MELEVLNQNGSGESKVSLADELFQARLQPRLSASACYYLYSQ